MDRQEAESDLMIDLFLFAGEPSGDLHGEELLKVLALRSTPLRIAGVGGPRMRAQGMHCLWPMEAFSVMGFIDPLRKLPKLMLLFWQIRKSILQKPPKVLLFIDYPGFALRMQKSLRKAGYRGQICHLICPSVWAWGRERIVQMAQHLDLLLSILPFEKQLFASTDLKVQYIGHPLAKRVEQHPFMPLALPPGRRIIGLFPGSRKKELRYNLPVQLRVAKRLRTLHPELLFALSVSSCNFQPWIEEQIGREGLSLGEEVLLVPQERTYDLMRSCELAIAKSGTITLELALHAVPTVVTYGTSFLDYLIAYHLLRIRLPWYCLVNILCNQELFAEWIGPKLTEASLFSSVEALLVEPTKREACKQQCRQLTQLLQSKDATAEAATAIETLLLHSQRALPLPLS